MAAVRYNKQKRKEIEQVCEKVLAEMRPFFKEDGGDITLETVTETGIVQVKLHGACHSCSMNTMTLQAGVIEAIKKVAPDVKGLEVTNQNVVLRGNFSK